MKIIYISLSGTEIRNNLKKKIGWKSFSFQSYNSLTTIWYVKLLLYYRSLVKKQYKLFGQDFVLSILIENFMIQKSFKKSLS